MKRISLVFLMILAGCTSGGTKLDAQQTLYQIEGDFLIAVTVADDYKALPACGSGVVLCSDASVVAKLGPAAKNAQTVIYGAEKTVRDPNFKGDLSGIVIAAQNALNVLTTLTAALKTH